MVKYGHEEQGSKNKLTKMPTTNAPRGEDTLSINAIILGLRLKGTSMTNHFPYRKKSLIFASHTTNHKIPTTSLRTNVLLAVAKAEKSPIPIAR